MSSRSLNVSINDAGERQKYLQCLNKLSKVMDVVQSDVFSGKNTKNVEKIKDKLLDEVQKIFSDVGLKIFSETLFRMMIVPFQSKDSPYVVKVIEFFFIMICDDRWFIDGANSQTNNSPNDTINTLNGSVIEDGAVEPLPMRILRLCEKYHQESRTIIRLRIMQTVAKIIPDRIEVKEIRKSLQVKLVKMLLHRIKDKSDQVRALSARNLCEFFVDDTPFLIQTLDALVDSMRYDPEHIVRAEIVSCIKITDDTLEHVVERTGDPNAIVRAAAIKRVSEHMKLSSLTIEMREAILKANITEDTPKNVEKAMNGLLESWLKCLENDPCEFLRILNVRRRANLCKTVLNSLYNQQAEEAFEKMSSPFLNDKRYPEDSLCIEGTYLWHYMYKRFKDEPYVYNKLAIPVNDMIEYIKEYIEVVEEEGDLPIGDLEYRSWMLGDLLQILSILPGEEGERKAILEFLPDLCLKKKLMDGRNSALVMKLISVCSDYNDETTVIDLINSLLDSERRSVRKSRTKSGSVSVVKPEEELNPNSDSATQLKLELGNLMHRRKKLERDRDIAVKQNDLYKAQACQEEINEVEVKISTVKDSIQQRAQNCLNDSTATDANETLEEEEEWTYSDKIILIVLSLAKSNILLRNQISDNSRTFYELYAVKAVFKCRDPLVRSLALELMCIIALEFEEESSRATLYCLMALLRDNINVKVTALKCLYDLVLRYSFSKLGGYEQVQGVLMGSNQVKKSTDDPVSTLKSLLLSYISNEDGKLVKISVAGVLKLLFKKEMNSSRLITTFLINWAIPSQNAQIRFKDVATMIPMYASMGENEAIEVAQCLLAAIKKAVIQIHSRAEGDELAPHPDIEKVVTLIVKCTDPERLTEFQRCYIAHETIANGALQELRKLDLTTEEKMHYAKLLKVLDLRHCPPESINQMIHSLAEITENSNKTITQLLRGFSAYLESLVENGDSATNRSFQAPGAFNDDSDNEMMDTS